MKTVATVLVLVLAILSLCLLAGCSDRTEQADFYTTDVPDALNKYTGNGDSFTLITVTKTQDNGKVYEETSKARLFTSSEQTHLQQTVTIGEQRIHSDWLYSDGCGYLILDGQAFSQEMDYSDFKGTTIFLPTIDMTLYRQITAHTNGNTSFVSLKDAIKAESWSLPAGSALTDASASVHLDSQNQITMILYRVCYTQQSRSTEKIFCAAFADPAPVANVIKPETSTELDLLASPVLLEYASARLQDASAVEAALVQTMASELTSTQREECLQISRSGYGQNLSVRIDTTATVYDNSRNSQISALSQTEQFDNERYVLTVDGTQKDPTTEPTWDGMANYCNNLLLQNILLPHHIQAVTYHIQNQILYLEFIGTEDLSSIICQDVCQTLYQDDATISEILPTCITDSITASLSIDLVTGLPVSCGIQYCGHHQLDPTSYGLEYRTQVSYLYA